MLLLSADIIVCSLRKKCVHVMGLNCREAFTALERLRGSSCAVHDGAVGGQLGSKHTTQATYHMTAAQINSGIRGRWDRNRTCNLRFWSTRRAVQRRPRTSSRSAVSVHLRVPHRWVEFCSTSSVKFAGSVKFISIGITNGITNEIKNGIKKKSNRTL